MVFLIQFFPLQHFNIKTQRILIPRKTTCITVPKTTSGTTCSTSLCARQLILANKKRLLWLCKSNSYPTRLQRTDIWFNYQFQHGQSTKHWTLICVSWHQPVSPDSCQLAPATQQGQAKQNAHNVHLTFLDPTLVTSDDALSTNLN